MKFRDLHRNIRIRLLVDFMQKIFNNMITSFMAIYLSTHFGAKVSGTMIMVALAIGILMSFYGGYYADLRGRKTVLVIAELSNVFIFFSMAICNSPLFSSPVITYLLFLLQIVVSYTASPAADAMIIDVSSPPIRKYVYGLSYWIVNLSFAIGALIGAFSYQKYFFQMLLAGSCSELIIFFVYVFFVSETNPRQGEELLPKLRFTEMFSSYRLAFLDKIFVKFLIASFLLMIIEFQLGNYISVRLASQFETKNVESMGYVVSISGIKMYGILRAENTIFVILFARFIKKLTSKLSDYVQLVIGILIYTFGYMVVGSSNNGWILIIAAFVFTLGEMIYVPIKQTLLSFLIKDDSRTQYMAVYGLHFRMAMIVASSFITLGAFIPPIGMSALYGFMGVGSLWIFYGILHLDVGGLKKLSI